MTSPTSKVKLQVDTVVTGDKDLDRLSRKTDKLGDEFDDARRDASHLDRELDRLRGSVRDLGREFDRTGDRTIFDKLKNVRKELAPLATLRKELDRIAVTEQKARRINLPQLPRGPRFDTMGALTSFSPTTAGLGIAGAGLLAPALGAGISAAGTLAGGGLVAGAGVAIAAHSNERVQAAFAQLASQISADAIKAADAFEAPLIRTAGIIRTEWRGVADDIDRLFEKAADSGAIEGFARGAAGFVREILPGLEKATEQLGKFAAIAEHKLPELGKSFGNMFDAFSRGSGGATAFFGDMIELTGEAAENLGNAAYGLSKIYEWADKVRDDSAWGQLTQGVVGFSEKIGEGKERAEEFNKAMQDGAKDLDIYAEKLDKVFGATMGLVDANLQYEQAVDDMQETLAANGRQWDISTERGRQNISAVKEAIDAAYQQRNAMIANGQSVAFADEQFRKAEAAILAQARAAGATTKVIGELTAAWDALLARQSTKILNVKVVETTAARAGTAGSTGRTLPFYASGTDSARGGLAVVGEEGPELVRFRGGEQVLPAGTSAAMMNGGWSGGGTTKVVHEVIIKSETGRELWRKIINDPMGPQDVYNTIAHGVRTSGLTLKAAGVRVTT